MSSYVIETRRKLHMYPEIGFDLPKTLSLVRAELEKMGLPYTEAYGKSSIVATLNEEKTNFTIGIRADMDALPITEKTKVPYASKIKGQMHACGHDAHTAILLDVARRLSEQKDKINCRVKFIFQSAEEYPPSGAKLMVEDGLMDDIDCIVAVKAYTAIELMIAKELPALTPCIFNAGSFHGGVTNNVICDHAYLYCTMRSWDEATDAKATKRIRQIIASVAKESGGRATYTQLKYYPIVYNHAVVADAMRKAAAAVLGNENIGQHVRSMGGEDFAYYAQKKPACMFRLGIRNEEKQCVYSAHQDRFNIDEDALSVGSDVFVRFVTDNMNGMEGIGQ